MNATELIAEVRELLDEPASSAATTPYFVDARILAWLNQAYMSFCRYTSWTVKMTNYLVGSTYVNASASVANSPIHNLPSDFMKLDSKSGVFWLDGTTLRMLHEMDKVQASNEGWFSGINTPGTPLYYNIRYSDSDLHGLDNPTSAPTLTVSGTGGTFSAVSGYKYKYTYYNSQTTQESGAPNGVSSGIFTNKLSVAVAYVESGDPNVDYIRIYRTADAGSSYYLVTTVANATSSYADNMDDATLITKTAFGSYAKSGYVLETYPYPSAAGNLLQAYYVALPTLLYETPTATSPIIPLDYQWALIYGAVSWGKKKRRLFDESRSYLNDMSSLFEQAKAEVEDRGPAEFDHATDVYLQYRY
jgi:hypothetical protein